MSRIEFGIIGAGWRAEFALRIAQALPEQFGITGVWVRNPEKRVALAKKWDVPAVDSLEALLATPRPPQFAFISVPWPVAPGMIEACAARGVPALCETPPAPDLAGLIRLHAVTEMGAKVQVAEQYALQPLHQAMLAVANSGRLGQVTQALVSVAHGYHGVHLLRKFLGINFEPVTIEARREFFPIVKGSGRDGPPAKEEVISADRLQARLLFEGGRFGEFDFAGEQYFSWIRQHRILVRGERGELDMREARWLKDHRTPMTAPLIRQDTGHGGNLEGYHHKGYTLGDSWVCENRFAPARLSDDEIAMAESFSRMADYVAGGPSCVDLRQASQDRYLDLLMDEAASTGKPVKSQRQPWM